MALSEPNRQTRKTRAALLDAFQNLILDRRYQDIRIADILRRADVGRSTFYEHFRNKDDLLRQSVSRVLVIVAATVEEDCDLKQIEQVMEHFLENGRLARGLLNGPSSPQIVLVLADLIEERLRRFGQEAGLTPLVPFKLVATHVSEAQLGLIRAWLNWGTGCSAAVIAAALHQSGIAVTRALFSATTTS